MKYREWTHNGQRYRLYAETRLHATTDQPYLRYVMLRYAGDELGWVVDVEWRGTEDGPTFGGLANTLLASFGVETSTSIESWRAETFGPLTGIHVLVERLQAELDELRVAVQFPAEHATIAAEAADVIIVAMSILGVCKVDAARAVDEKMQINRGRSWRSNGDGTGQHIKEPKS